MVIKDGRFGPYVTDGETNASLRKGDDVLSITDERAAELLADRRAPAVADEEGGQEGAGEGRRPRLRRRCKKCGGKRCTRALHVARRFLAPAQMHHLPVWPTGCDSGPAIRRLADVPVQRLRFRGDVNGEGRPQDSTRSNLANSVRRAASFTGSPITVYSKRC